MALRTPPRHARHSPHRPLHGQRTARAHQNPLLQSLSNMAGQSGGTPPGGGGGQQPPPDPMQAPWESDPVLQQIKQIQAANIAVADAHAQQARQQALINFGYSPELAPLYGDEGTKGAAQANPYSILSQLGHEHELRQHGLNEGLNKANLFYSSYRGNQLGEEARGYLGQQATAGERLRQQLSGYSDSDAAAHQAAQAAITEAQQNAYERYLNQQLQYGLGGTGGGAAPAAGGAAAHAGGGSVLSRLRRQRGARPGRRPRRP